MTQLYFYSTVVLLSQSISIYCLLINYAKKKSIIFSFVAVLIAFSSFALAMLWNIIKISQSIQDAVFTGATVFTMAVNMFTVIELLSKRLKS